jgi:hypothetical protein
MAIASGTLTGTSAGPGSPNRAILRNIARSGRDGRPEWRHDGGENCSRANRTGPCCRGAQAKSVEAIAPAMGAVLAAVASGEISPSEGQAIAALLGQQRQAFESAFAG